MRLSYRQGLVAAQSGFLQLNANNGVDLVISPNPVLATVASGQTDYLIGEYSNVTNAWGPFPTNNTTHYLYWEINQFSGAVMRGATPFPLIIAGSAPATPPVGQMWWDATNVMMKVWNGSTWTPTLRVLAGSLQGAALVAEPFLSQVGLNVPADAGFILTDGFGSVFRDNNGTILTTETPAMSNDTGSLVKLNGAQFIVQANESLPAFACVYLYEGRAALASCVPPDDVTKAPIAMTAGSAAQNSPVSLITSGKMVFNQQWAWTPTQWGQPVYTDAVGTITMMQPGTNKFIQVGVITGPQSILLDFTSVTEVASGGGGSGTVSEVLGIAPVTITGTTAFPVVSIPQVTTSANGYLSSADYNTFLGYAGQIATKVSSSYSGWSIAQVVGLQGQLNTFVTSAQNWPMSQITGLDALFATYVTAAQTWPIGQIVGLQGQLNNINTSLNNKMGIISGNAGNLTMVAAGGQIADSGIAAIVISGKANMVSPVIVGDFASLTAAGDLADSGFNASSFATPSNITTLQNEINTINVSLGTKVGIVSAAVAGHFAAFISGGDIVDSGFNSASFAPAVPTANSITTINGEITTINSTLNNKVDKVLSALAGNFATFIAGGDIADSGSSAASFIAVGTQFPQSQIIGLTTALNSKVNKSGDTMTGTLILPAINVGNNVLINANGSLSAGGSTGNAGQVLSSNGPNTSPTWIDGGSADGDDVPYDSVTSTITVDNVNATSGMYGQDSMAITASSIALESTYFDGASNTVSASLLLTNSEMALMINGTNQLVISGNGSWSVGSGPYANLTGNPGDILTSNGNDAQPTWQNPAIAPAPMNMLNANGNQFDFGSSAHHNAHLRIGTGNTPNVVNVRAESFFTGTDPYWANNYAPQNPAPMPLGGFALFTQASQGVITFVPDAGVTINSPSSLITAGEYTKVTITKVGPDQWDIEGHLG